MTHRMPRARSAALALLGAIIACSEITVPNTNNPSIDELETNPSAATVFTATQGLLIGERAQVGTFALTMGILGREVYNLDPAEPRTVNGYLVGPLEPGGFGTDFGWTGAYRNLQLGETILRALDKVTTISNADKEAIRGFVKTIQALDLQNQIRIRDSLGIVIDIAQSRSGPLPAIVTKDAAYTRIFALYDQGKTHLLASGGTFPFRLTSGFAGFNTPVTFLRFNRALRARASILTGRYAQALTDLSESFLSTSASLNLGVFHVYSINSGDAVNPLFDATPRALVAHPSFLSDAQNRPDGTKDLRATTKVVVGTRTLTQQGVTSNLRITLYPTSTSPIAIIRNEELILMRAEARYFTGDQAGALADINLIRVNSGGLAARAAFASQADFIGELLYNRRYSLFFEYGSRWVDARRFGLLATLPKALAAHRVFPYVPFPLDECAARSPAPGGCVLVPGI